MFVLIAVDSSPSDFSLAMYKKIIVTGIAHALVNFVWEMIRPDGNWKYAVSHLVLAAVVSQSSSYVIMAPLISVIRS